MNKLPEWEEMQFEDRLMLKLACQRSFLNFTRIFFELIQGEQLLVNWHHRWIAREIDSIVKGGNSSQNITISIPPGGTKTEFMSIHLASYVNMLVSIGVLDKFRNLNLSYADTLVRRNSRRTRDIISSKEYQEFWPCTFGVNQAEEWQVVDVKGRVKGETVSRSMGGQITGGRGGYFGSGFSGSVNMDDPMKADDAFSVTKREAHHRQMVNTVRSRRGDKSKDHPTPFFIIQQRLHVDDTVGFCLAGGMGVKFKSIVIPALINQDFIDTLDEQTRIECVESIKGSESVVINGVPHWSYWPEMEHVEQLHELMERDEYTFMSQYQQTPIKASGGLIETSWFTRYEKLPYLEWMAVYVDTNSGKIKDRNDYTVFSLVGKCKDGQIYIMDIRRGKWDPLGLLDHAKMVWTEWSSMAVLLGCRLRYMKIEDKQAGQGLIQTLKDEQDIPVVAVQRGQGEDKFRRHNNCQPQIKTGKVHIPAIHSEDGERLNSSYLPDGSVGFNTQWVVPFVQECDLLTVEVLMDQEKGYDDQYDTIMDAIDDMAIPSSTSGIVLPKRR